MRRAWWRLRAAFETNGLFSLMLFPFFFPNLWRGRAHALLNVQNDLIWGFGRDRKTDAE
jgi:hypothetical protein